MKQKVSIARALKEKNRVAGRLKKALEEIKKENSKLAWLPRGINVEETFEHTKALRQRLIEIKSAIAIANQKIVTKIIELGEVKSQINFLNDLETKEGVFSTHYRDSQEEYSAIITRGQALKEMEHLQKHADRLQDDLDNFNATTTVEIEID